MFVAVRSELDKLLKWVKLKWILINLHLKSLLLIHFFCDECRKHEAMINSVNKENKALRKENAELKAEKSLTNLS